MNKAYKEYLNSPHWRETRKAALERAWYRCQLCNSEKNLNVHHNNYDRLWYESPRDLIVLCSDCHAKFHDIIDDDDGREPDVEKWYTDEESKNLINH